MEVLLWVVLMFIIAGFYNVLHDILHELRGIRKELQSQRGDSQ